MTTHAATEQAVDGQAANGRTADQQTADQQTVGQQTVGQQTVGEQTADGQTVGEPTVGEQTADGQTVGEPTVGEQTADGQTVGEPTVGEQTAGHQTPRRQRASQRITAEVGSWPRVEAGPGRRGEFAFRVGRREIGHLHGDHAAHFLFPQDTWSELARQGRITEHPVFPGRVGPAARRIETDADVQDVIALMRLNYDRISR